MSHNNCETVSESVGSWSYFYLESHKWLKLDFRWMMVFMFMLRKSFNILRQTGLQINDTGLKVLFTGCLELASCKFLEILTDADHAAHKELSEDGR